MSTSAAAAPNARAGRLVVVGQRHQLVGADGRERGEPLGVAPRADHGRGAEPLRHLDRHRPRVPGRAEHEHALTGLQRDAAAQRDPRRHRRVHRGGDLRHVHAVGQFDRAANVDDRLVGHRPERVIVGDEVDPGSVRSPPDARRSRGSSGACRCSCNARPPRRCARAGAVRPRARRRASRRRRRLRGVELLVVRWLVERRHHGCVHLGHAGPSYRVCDRFGSI